MALPDIWKQGLGHVFAQGRFAGLFAGFLLLLALLYLTFANIFSPFTLSFNPDASLPEAFLIIIAASLASLGFTIAVYQAFVLRNLTQIEQANIFGGILGLFASVCVIYQPLWVAWWGLGGLAAFLLAHSIFIILASIAFMLFFIHIALREVGKCCALAQGKRKKRR